MNVLVVGATGLVGRALVLRLRRDGHRVLAAVRNIDKARSLLGHEAELVGLDDASLTDAVNLSHAVVNLAGEPVIVRWTQPKRKSLVDSRVRLTERLVQTIRTATDSPRVFVSASAIGFYGDRGDEVLDERSARGNGFLAELCEQWEQAALSLQSPAVRVAVMRIGIVLDQDAGALARMLPIFRLGLGGKLGSGKQYMSVIHLDDLVDLINAALTNPRYRGPVNATSPEPLTNEQFTQLLSAALHKPAIASVPAATLRLSLGEAASILLGSQRVKPTAALENGFAFRCPTARDAIESAISGGETVTVKPLESFAAGHPYLEQRPPTHELYVRTELGASVEEVAPFFSKPENLGLLTPSAMQFRMTSAPDEIKEGARISYSLRVFGVPIRWRTLIARWVDKESFVDAQEKGPYHSWWHEHSFEKHGDATIMVDRVRYAAPFGVIGRAVNRLIIQPELKRIFAYRNDVIRRRFRSSLFSRTTTRAGVTQ